VARKAQGQLGFDFGETERHQDAAPDLPDCAGQAKVTPATAKAGKAGTEPITDPARLPGWDPRFWTWFKTLDRRGRTEQQIRLDREALEDPECDWCREILLDRIDKNVRSLEV